MGKENDVVREEEKARRGKNHNRDREGGKVIKRKRVANVKICQRRKEGEGRRKEEKIDDGEREKRKET